MPGPAGPSSRGIVSLTMHRASSARIPYQGRRGGEAWEHCLSCVVGAGRGVAAIWRGAVSVLLKGRVERSRFAPRRRRCGSGRGPMRRWAWSGAQAIAANHRRSRLARGPGRDAVGEHVELASPWARSALATASARPARTVARRPREVGEQARRAARSLGPRLGAEHLSGDARLEPPGARQAEQVSHPVGFAVG